MNTFFPLTIRARRPLDLALSASLPYFWLPSPDVPMQVKFGWKVYLDRTPVTSMDAKLEKGP
jgi:hypothetical protein